MQMYLNIKKPLIKTFKPKIFQQYYILKSPNQAERASKTSLNYNLFCSLVLYILKYSVMM